MKRIVLLIAVMLLTAAVSQAEVRIIGIDIPGLYQKDGKGVYDQVVGEVVVKQGLAAVQTLPPARAENDFSKCLNCCMSPANGNPEFYELGPDMTVSDPMNHARVYVFTRKGEPLINSLEGLKGKKNGIRHGMPYGKSFENADLNVQKAHTLASNFKKLEKGRLDAVVAYIPDAYIYFKEQGMEPFPHDVDRPLVAHDDALLCRGVDQSFMDAFNSGLKGLRDSGKLKSLLGDGYVE